MKTHLVLIVRKENPGKLKFYSTGDLKPKRWVPVELFPQKYKARFTEMSTNRQIYLIKLRRFALSFLVLFYRPY